MAIGITFVATALAEMVRYVHAYLDIGAGLTDNEQHVALSWRTIRVGGKFG